MTVLTQWSERQVEIFDKSEAVAEFHSFHREGKIRNSRFGSCPFKQLPIAGMVEFADTGDLKSPGLGR